MKNFTKIFLIIISALITIQFLSLSFLILAPVVNAEEIGLKKPLGFEPTDIRDNIKVPFGDFADLGSVEYVVCSDTKDGETATATCWQIPWIAKYIGNAYRYGVVIGSILAVMMIMIGGIMYMIGGLNQSLIGRGKEYIVGAVTGLILLLGSYVVLQTINPNLVHLQPIEVEVIKEAVILNSNWCSEVAKSDFEIDPVKNGDKGTSGAQWETTNSCGENFPVKLKDEGGLKKAGEGQTCLSDKCVSADQACIEDPAGGPGDWKCLPVLMYGRMTIPDKKTMGGMMTLLQCDMKLLAGDGFYVENVQVVAINPNGFSKAQISKAPASIYWPVTKEIPVGLGKQYFYIEKKDIIAPFNSGTAYDNWLVALDIEINDASWVILPTVDDDFITVPKTAIMGANEYEVAWSDVCRFKETGADGETKYVNHLFQVQYHSGRPIFTEAGSVTFGELKSGTKAIKWNVNVTQDFFSCAEGSTVSNQVDCFYMDSLTGKFDRKAGEGCDKDSDCIFGLNCLSNKKCGTQGGVDAPCDNNDDCGRTDCTCSGDDETVCDHDRSNGNECNKVGVGGWCNCKTITFCNEETDKCAITKGEAGSPCVPDQSGAACGDGLICDDNTNKCVIIPASCEKNSDCPDKPGYNSSDCSNGWCDCDGDSGCDEGYRCADNTTGMYDNADMCVPE